MTFTTITSLSNALIKQVVSLHAPRERKKSGLCIIEGSNAIETALARLSLEKLYCTDEQRALASALAANKDSIIVSNPVMKKMSTASSPSGILATFKIPPQPDPRDLKPGLVLAQISDPGNMGTLIRTAAACAVRSVIIIEGADPWSPKVVQATAGTIALVDIFQWDWKTLVASKGALRLYGLVVEGGSAKKIDASNALIIVGNESRGIPHEWQEQCDSLITLPMPGATESLNAAVAGSIALYETFVRLDNQSKSPSTDRTA